MNEDPDKIIDTPAEWLYESRYPVVFTGAGISTESGLTDFRGPDGLWTRRDKGLASKPMSKPWDSVDPVESMNHVVAGLQRDVARCSYPICQGIYLCLCSRNSLLLPKMLRGKI